MENYVVLCIYKDIVVFFKNIREKILNKTTISGSAMSNIFLVTSVDSLFSNGKREFA
jgi:hypothetical protein